MHSSICSTIVTTELTSGSWIAGIDIPAGKYVCKVALEEQSMSVTVYSSILIDKAGPFQLGGNYSEPELAITFEEGQVIFFNQPGTLICTPE